MSIAGAQLWELVPAAVGAVLGAAAAALPAYHLARRSALEILARDSAQRISEDRARAFRILTVFQTISNSLFTLRGMMRDMLARPVDENEATPNQRKISAIVGFSFEITERFKADDLSMIAASTDQGLVTDLSRLAASHAAICSSLAVYQTLKAKNHDLMSEGSEHRIVEDVIHSVIRDPRLAAKIRITDVQLESMIVQILDMIEQDCRCAISIAERFNKVMKDTFVEGQRPALDLSGVYERYPDLRPLN